METKVESLAKEIRSLLPQERIQLMSMLRDEKDDPQPKTLTSYVADSRFSGGVVCPYCGGSHVKRNGHRKDGTQKYVCVSCNKSFTSKTGTIVASSRNSLEKWRKYADCMANKMSLRDTAEDCDISVRTAFMWRHKILDALAKKSSDVSLSGIVESDDTYFAVSYKGNHLKSANFDMGRPSRKRGRKGVSRGLSEDLVCVPCAVDRRGNSVAEISNLGSCTAKDIEHVLGGRIDKGSSFCTDGSKAQKKFAQGNGLEYIPIKGGKSKRGIYHIEHVNNYHSTLKIFINNFHGVSTKYLNNYLAWNDLVNYSKHTRAEKQALLLDSALSASKVSTWHQIPRRPAIPVQ